MSAPWYKDLGPSIGASLISISNRPYNTITSTHLSPNRFTRRRGAAPTIKIHKHYYNQQSPQSINGATFRMCTLNFEVCDDFLQRQQKCGPNDSGVGWLLLLFWWRLSVYCRWRSRLQFQGVISSLIGAQFIFPSSIS